MNLDDLKEQLADQWQQSVDKLQESNLYNTLVEKFQSLSSNMQKLVISLFALLVVFILLSYPLSYLDSAKENEEAYDNNLKTLRALLKVDAQQINPNELPQEIPSSQLRGRLDSVLTNNKLLEEQKAGISQLTDGELKKNLVSNKIKQLGYRIDLKKLNLRQVVEIGDNLQRLDQKSLKLVDMQVKAAGDNYFDATYKVINFFVPFTIEKEEPSTKNKRGRRGK